MKKSELIAALNLTPEDFDVKVIIADGAEHLDELEEGSVLSIEDTGYSAPLRSIVLYVQPS